MSEFEKSAEDSLKDLRRRAGIISSVSPDAWTFHRENILNGDLSLKLGVTHAQLRFLQSIKAVWRPRDQVHRLPADWIPKTDKLDLSLLEYDPDISRVHSAILLHLLRAHVIGLTPEEVLVRHRSLDALEPDFALAVYRTATKLVSMEDALHVKTDRALQQIMELFLYQGNQMSADFVISSMFDGIPGCWIRQSPTFHFPSCFGTEPTTGELEFAVALNPIQAIRTTTIRRAKVLPISLLSPALIFAAKSPDPWFSLTSTTGHSSGCCSREDMAYLAQPNLETLIITCFLRHQQGVESPHDPAASTSRLPPWAVLFGIQYDAHAVNIIAHIPIANERDASFSRSSGSVTYRYASVVIDSLPFPAKEDKTDAAWMAHRLRLGMALLTLQKHAFRLSSLWERVVWPWEIENAGQIMEREVTGITSPLPSDITDMNEIWFEGGGLQWPPGDSEAGSPPPNSAVARWLSACEKENSV